MFSITSKSWYRVEQQDNDLVIFCINITARVIHFVSDVPGLVKCESVARGTSICYWKTFLRYSYSIDAFARMFPKRIA